MAYNITANILEITSGPLPQNSVDEINGTQYKICYTSYNHY